MALIPTELIFGKLHALVLSPAVKAAKVLVLLHGVGSNEKNLLDVGQKLADDRMIISLRAPLTMGPQSFAWFQVQFTQDGPIHNWPQAKSSFVEIEDALGDISKKTGIMAKDISIFGFSQGAIMTIGLALNSELRFEKYIAASGRTLLEFADLAKKMLPAELSQRRIQVVHGINDSKLPVSMARATEKTLKSLKLDLTYKEYAAEHEIPTALIEDIKKWLR